MDVAWPDRGVALPGSDPERRKQIRKQINVIKSYMAYFSTRQQIPVKAGSSEVLIQSSEAAL